MTLTEKDEQYLTQLVVKAKQKVKTEYDVEIKREVTIDMEKTLEQNRALIIQSIRDEKEEKLKARGENPVKKATVTKSTTSKEDKQKEAQEQAKAEAEELKKIKEQEAKAITDWKKQFNPDMIIQSPAYFEMEKYIEMVCAGLSNFCIVHSQGGLAKTWSSQAILKKKKEEYAYLNSFTSPLELYNFLYDNSQGKVILIDDCEGIWDNKSIISILKNATELNGERTIGWNSTTSKLEGRANTCAFSSRIILLTNQLPNIDKNRHIEALLSRAFLCKLNFSHQEKIDVIKEVSKREYKGVTAENRKEIFDFINRNTNEATKDLSIRTLIKCYHFYLFDKVIWKELGLRILKTEQHREVVYELMNGGKAVKDQEQAYHNKTGRSRADFYRVKQEVIANMKKAEYPKAKE